MAEDMQEEILRHIQEDYDSLPYPAQNVEVAVEERMLPMPDGVRLKTYLFHEKQENLETGSRAFPVILQRSPYFHAMDVYRVHGMNLVRRGFLYVVQCCRGTGESEGIWEPNINERQDGLHTVRWLAAQDWTERIGYWGDSYLALTGWCMADELPDKVKGMYLGVYGTDRFTSAYCKGLFRHDVLTAWAMENAGHPVTADYLESCRFRPHNRVDEALWGGALPWYRDWIGSVKEEDPYWQEGLWYLLRKIPQKVNLPLLIREGWYDHHLGSALKSYEALNGDAAEHATLEIGSWNHGSMNCLEWDTPKNLKNSEVESMLSWFWQILVEGKMPERQIRIYVIGADRWLEPKEWPIPAKEYKVWYLSAQPKDGDVRIHRLSDRPAEPGGKVEYTYNPDDPVPSLGGEAMLKTMEHVGSLYQPEAGWRQDVVSFLSEPAVEEFTIAGKIRVHLLAASDCEDTAFSAKLMEVREDGKAVNIRSSITTIAADLGDGVYRPGNAAELTVEMWDIAWQVKKGSRLRLDISSSDFPQYAAHTNFPGAWSAQEKCRIARQTIFCDREGSRLEIPVICMEEEKA